MENSEYFPGLQNHCSDCSNEIKRRLLLARKATTNLDSILQSRDITLPTKVHILKAMVFPIVMYGCESWNIQKAEYQTIWCFQIVMLEKTFESLLDSKEIKPVHPKGSTLNIHWKDWWSWSSNTLATWCDLIGKDPDTGKDWRQEKGATEDEKTGWHHQLNGHEFQQTPGDSKGQGSLACGSPWGCKELDTTERLNNKVYKSWGDCILQENPVFRQFYGLSSKT